MHVFNQRIGLSHYFSHNHIIRTNNRKRTLYERKLPRSVLSLLFLAFLSSRQAFSIFFHLLSLSHPFLPLSPSQLATGIIQMKPVLGVGPMQSHLLPNNAFLRYVLVSSDASTKLCGERGRSQNFHIKYALIAYQRTMCLPVRKYNVFRKYNFSCKYNVHVHVS